MLPTDWECDNHELISVELQPGLRVTGYALWTPQIGGYRAKALLDPGDGHGCFNLWIWHDGEFPSEQAVNLHFCDLGQMQTFVKDIEGLLEADAAANA